MLTHERKAKMIEMHKNGMTYEDIGKAFNLSKQRVYSIIGGNSKNRFKMITKEDCIFPNLRRWMNDNRITREELCRRIFRNNHPVNKTQINEFLKGKHRDIRKSTIDKYLSVTELTYEQLFEVEGE